MAIMPIEISTVDPNSGFELYVQPSGKRPAWILWVRRDGSGQISTRRADDGSTFDDDEPIQLKKNGRTYRRV